MSQGQIANERFCRNGKWLSIPPRPISPPMNPKPTIYRVEILETLPNGQHTWRGLLSTKDEGEAKALLESLLADEGVRARIEEDPPGG